MMFEERQAAYDHVEKTGEDGTFTLSPSLLHSGTCTCHYYWRRGKAVSCDG